MRRGMREWMNACSLCLAPSPTKEFTAAPDRTVLPQGAPTEVVLILAGMLLHQKVKATHLKRNAYLYNRRNT